MDAHAWRHARRASWRRHTRTSAWRRAACRRARPAACRLPLNALLLCAALAACTAAEDVPPPPPPPLPVNDKRVVAHLCRYGDLPGTWALPPPPPGSLLYLDGEPFGWGLMPFSNDSERAPFGSRWQLLDTSRCRLRNLISPFLDGSRAPVAPEASVKLLAVADSSDAHLLNYYVETLRRRLGGNETEAYRRVFNGSRILLHDRGQIPRLNHAITRSGLSLFHMYVMGVDQRQPEHVQRVEAARKQFDDLMPPIDGRPQQPDLISLHVNHWSLKVLHEGWLGPEDIETSKLPELPPSFVASFMQNLTALALLVRKLFPGVLMTYHTSCMVRHDIDTGKQINGNGKQLNAAGRQVARTLRMPLVDWELIMGGLVPTRYLYDDIHPIDWPLFEFYNILLNWVEDVKELHSSGAAPAVAV